MSSFTNEELEIKTKEELIEIIKCLEANKPKQNIPNEEVTHLKDEYKLLYKSAIEFMEKYNSTEMSDLEKQVAVQIGIVNECEYRINKFGPLLNITEK